jgi:hypothetical protein
MAQQVQEVQEVQEVQHLDIEWKALQATFEIGDLTQANFFTLVNGPEGIDDTHWQRMFGPLLKKLKIHSLAEWDTKIKNSSYRFQLIKDVTRGAMYDPLLKKLENPTGETDDNQETEDLREVVKANLHAIADQTVGHCSVAKALFVLCPESLTRMEAAIDQQQPWTNLKKRGSGKGSRKRKAQGQVPAGNNNATDAAAAGGGGGAAPTEYNEPPPAKKAKTSPSAFGDAISETPDEYQCPITMEVMNDPVMAADGHTYERAAIEQWFSQNSSGPILSPKTNRGLPNTGLTPNHALKALIQDHLQSRAGGGGSSSA